MPSYLCFTIRFLQPFSHGRGEDGTPEWPPSPFRLFQALVSASAARWNERMQLAYAVPALTWLESLPPPRILCSLAETTRGYRLYVPDNVGDKVASSWSGGRSASMADYRTEKDVRAKRLSGQVVRYLFPVDPNHSEVESHLPTLRSAAESITHLGWGIDMVVGYAEIVSDADVEKLEGETWLPTSDQQGTALRVCISGSLQDLMKKHEGVLHRLAAEEFRPVTPLSCFEVINYRPQTQTVVKPFVTFDLLKPDGSGYRIFNTQRQFHIVSGLVRHATSEVCRNWPYGEIGSFIHGHDSHQEGRPLKGEGADDRFMFLPLPSIEHRPDSPETVTDIRRVMICTTPPFRDRIDWIRRRLSGHPLISESNVEVAELSFAQPKNYVIQKYVKSASIWSTVIPVTLPGYDDRNPEKTEKLLQKSLLQAGISQELVQTAEFEWRPVGFRAGCDLAYRYDHPKEIRGPRYHVRIKFARSICGPLAIGAGRYRGCGLFAAQD